MTADVRRPRRLWRDDRGVTMLEFGIVGPVFLVAMLMAFDLAFTMYTAMTLDTALDMAARRVIIDDVRTAADFRTELCARASAFVANCAGGVSVYAASATLPAAAAGLAPVPAATVRGGGFDIGGPSDFVLLEIAYPMPRIARLLGGPVDILSTVMVQREPFPTP